MDKGEERGYLRAMNSSEEHPSGRISGPDLSLAIPCYNESAVVKTTVRDLVEAFGRSDTSIELVLVDNGSTDDTGAIIDGLVAEGHPIVKREVAINEGYGNGVLVGLASCTGRTVGFICADGQVDARDVVKLYEAVARSSTPKLAKVRRRFRMDGAKRKVVSIIYNGFANVVFMGLQSIDINGNPKIFPREYLERMDLRSTDWFLDAEVMLRAKQLGLPVFEMNVFAQMRPDGESHVRSSTIWEFILNLLRWRFRTPPPVSGGSLEGTEHSSVEVGP